MAAPLTEQINIILRVSTGEVDAAIQKLSQLATQINNLKEATARAPMIQQMPQTLRQVADSTSIAKEQLAGLVGATTEANRTVTSLLPNTRLVQVAQSRWLETLENLGVSNADLNNKLIASSSVLQEYGIRAGIAREMTRALDRAYLMTGRELSLFASNLGMSAQELLSLSIATDRATLSNRAFAFFLAQQRAQMPIMSRLVRMYGQDWYWAALGFMFVTMSQARLVGASARAEDATLSLTRAYRQLYEAQRVAREAIERYGQGSYEATRAQVRLREVEMNVRIQRQQIVAQLMQARLAHVMLYAGAVPLVVNFYRILAESMAIYRAAILTEMFVRRQNMIETLTGIGLTRQEAAAKAVLSTATRMDSSALQMNTVAKTSNLGVTKMLTAANYALGASFGFARTMALLLGAALGVAALQGLMMRIVMWQAEQEMRQYEEEAKRLTRELAVTSLDDALQSVSKATRESREAFRSAREELRNLALTGREFEATVYPPIRVALNVSPREEAKYRVLQREIENELLRVVKSRLRVK